MAKTKNITETGPKALRGVRNPDLYPSLSLGLSSAELLGLKDNLARAKYANYNAAHGHLGYLGLNDLSLYTPLIDPNLDYGSSTYDEGVLVDANLLDIDNLRAENLSTLAKAAAGITKGIILAGTTFVDGTAGLLVGLGQGISNALDGDKDTSFSLGFWDNSITKLMGELNNGAEKELVNYRTEEEINGPWYSWDNLTSANFIFDTVIKNMGFTVGAALAGGIYTKAISWGAKAIGLAKLGLSSAATLEAGLKAMLAANATRSTKALVGSFFNAHAEAVQEAYNASLDFIITSNKAIDSRIAELKRLAMQEFLNSGGSILEDGSPNPSSDPDALVALNNKLQLINAAGDAAKQEAIKLSKNVGTMDGLMNIPILWASNVAMFGKMYSGGWKSARNATTTTARATKEAIREAKAAAKAGDLTKMLELEALVTKARQTGYQGLTQAEKSLVEEIAPHVLGLKAGVAWAAVKGPLREGNEEMLQGAAAQAAHYRYENEVDKIFDAKMDLDSTYEVRDFIGSALLGFKNQYGDIDNYEEAFVGALTGLLGSPTLGKANNATDLTYLGKSKWIGLSGGAFTEVRDYLKDRRTADLAALDATEILRRETLSDDIKHLIALTKFSDTMDKAIIHDDEKEYKDARTASIFEMVTHLLRVNRLDLLQRAMLATTEFTDEDIAEIANSVSKLVSATTPDVQAKVKLKERVEKDIETILDSYGDIHAEALLTGDSSKIDATDEMLEKKRAELAQLEAEINKAKPVTISPYIHKDGTAFTQEEIKQDINKRVEQFLKIIDTIALAHDQIDNATSGQLTNELLDTLTWYKVMMNDWNERADGITNLWQELITKLANDPSLVSSVEAILEVEDLLKEAGLDPKEAKVQFGGRFDQLKRIKNYSNILQQLKEAAEAGGINLAYLLTSTLTVKGKGTNETVGDIISKQMELVLQGDTSISLDIKDAFLKNLNDLKSIGKGHRRYNELLDEYLKKPEKIDEAHQASTNRAQAKSSKLNLSNVIDSLDVNSPIGSIARYLKENTDKIKNAGGFEKFIENLTSELQEKVRLALKLVMGLDSLDYLIDLAKLEDELAQILRNIIDDSIDEADTIELLAKSIKDSIKEGDVELLIRDSVPEELSELLTLQLIEAAEVALSKFIDDNLEKLAKASDEAERVINEELEKIKKLAAKTKDPSEDIEREAAKTTDTEKPLEAPSEDDSNKLFESDEVVNPTTSTIARQVNKKNSISPQVGQSGFNRRRQISQYYLQGEDKETLPKHYEEHPEDIPTGVNKDAFLKYIKAVHKKLVESGAYTYISGVNPNLRLKEGLEIRFTTDAKLNKEAGVPVILMVVTDELGHDLIIGSLPTSLDFQAKKRGSDKTVGETYPEDKALYDTLCEELLSRQSTLQSKTLENLTKAIEKLSRIEKALASSDVKLWSDNPWDNVTITTTYDGFHGPFEKSRLTASASDYRDALKGKVGDTVRDKAKIVFRDRHGNTYIEVLDAKDGKVKSAIVFPVEGRAGDNYTVYFYKTFTPDERDIIISYILEHKKNNKDLVKILNTLLLHSNDNLIYLSYRDPNKLAEARLKALVLDKSENTIDVNTLKPGDIVKFQGTNIKITKVEENILYGDMGGSEVEIKKSQFDLLTPFLSTELKAEENQKVSNITTKVEALRGGHPSFSSLNRSVSEVFGDNPIPITIILTKGPKSSSAVKNPVNVALPIDGLVYVYVTSNTGVLKPLLCFSTPLRDLANNDWYIELTIQAVLNLSEAINLGSSKSNLLRWLPFLNNLHVNILDSNGTKFVLLGWGENKEGKFTNTYSIRIQEDGTISSKDALSFIKTVSGRKITTATGEKIYPTTNVDRKLINNEEYLKNISRYIKVNITSDSPRTIDDWFTYEPTELLKRGEKPSSVNLAVLPSGKLKPLLTVLTSKGEATVSSAGTVTIEGDKELTKAEEKAILKEASKEASKGEDISSIAKESKGSILDTAFGAGSVSNDEMPDTSRRRRRRRPSNGDTKFSLVSLSEPLYTPEMQSIKDKAIADGTFMKAPNGKPTNLTERQWLQVRTKNFINWFGDWINNPAEASQVVDENGEPLVVYHGSKDNSFTIFDSTKNDKGQKGFFFTDDKTMASSYGKNPRGFFINSRNPYIIEGHNNNWNNLTVGVTDIAKDKLDSIRLFRNDLLLQLKEGKTSKETYDFWNNKYFKLYNKYLSLSNSFIDKIKKIAILNRLNKFDGEGNFLKSTRYTERVLELDREDVNIIFKSIKDYGPVFNKEASVNMINNVAANVYVVTNRNNIKSATDNIGGFSTTNDDIRYSIVTELQSIERLLASSQEIEKNLEKVAAMFPKLAKEGRIVLVKGLIDVVDKKGNPRKAYGMFRNGVLYISDLSPKGTAFHEAFHYIADTLLTDAEWEIMFDEATKIWGDLSDLELEENLSEAFREFMNEREDHSIKGKLNNIFLKLKHIILSIVGRENYLDSLFWSIYRNKMQDRVDNTSEDTFKQELLRYKAEKLKYSNLDLETKDYLSARKFSEENYEKLSIELKEILLSCM